MYKRQVEWYHSVYNYARTIEGAAQRVQEDTIKFGRIMEGLGTSLIESVMIIVQFLPILLGLSAGIPIFFFGEWEYVLQDFRKIGVARALMNKIEEIAKEKNLDLIIKGVEKSNLLAQKLFKNYAVVNRTRYLKKHN